MVILNTETLETSRMTFPPLPTPHINPWQYDSKLWPMANATWEWCDDEKDTNT